MAPLESAPERSRNPIRRADGFAPRQTRHDWTVDIDVSPGSSHSPAGPPRQLADRFDHLIDRIEQAEVRVPEDSALISLAADLVPNVTRLLREGIELLCMVEDLYDPDRNASDRAASTDDADSLGEIGLQISAEFAMRDLNNVAFFARSDLRNALDKLMTSATQQGASMILASHCESGMRRIRKALISVESAIYEFEGLEAPQRRWFDVEVSLQIRKLYWNLRRETSGKNVDASKPLEDRLRAVLYRIVAFRELSVYPLLRVEDRVTLRRLLKRMLDWLNSSDRPQLEARRLWDDLEGFAGLLVQVSHRQELRDHDLALLGRLLAGTFPGGRATERVPDRLLEQAEALLGLDEELDEIILAKDATAVEVWRGPLERLRKRLSSSRQGQVASLDLLSDS